MKIGIMRLGHRTTHDRRTTSHVFLVARAFGADFGVLSGDRDENLINSIRKVVMDWGGDFDIRYERKWERVLKEWKGKIIHLTMYGTPLREKINEIRTCGEDLIIIVGSSKVPDRVYHLVDWNISVTSQPHSEIASLSCFLDHYFEGRELDRIFENARFKIIPTKKGKRIVRTT
ncbi:MAG: tRNA (cytidine(56)-2'-O)-methyltransferase [Promethearchaeota archaeon]